MKPYLLFILSLWCLMPAKAQNTQGDTKTYNEQGFSSSFNSNSKIVSFGMGFPNLYRLNYQEPYGYTHIKTTGFGPFYAKFEFGAFDHVGLVASYAYSTFHYSYFGAGQQQVIHYDDVNAMSLSLSANYHFNKWITNPRLDVYAGAGVAANYVRTRYGNIPPFRERESQSEMFPVGRIGARYYIDPIFGLYGEAGFDGLSVIQLGFSVKF
jgi:hypothetical protein